MTGSSIDAFVKVARARDKSGEGERWSREEVSPTCNAFDNGDGRSVVLAVHDLTMCEDLKINFVTYAESCPAILATSHKDKPVVYKGDMQ